MTTTTQHPSQSAFDADVARFDRAFREAGALFTIDEFPGEEFIDPTKIPADMAEAYHNLMLFGYANGLID